MNTNRARTISILLLIVVAIAIFVIMLVTGVRLWGGIGLILIGGTLLGLSWDRTRDASV